MFEDRFVVIFGGGFDRERLNRRGNWLGIVDIETGRVLIAPTRAAGSIAGAGPARRSTSIDLSEPAALDMNGDGYLTFLLRETPGSALAGGSDRPPNVRGTSERPFANHSWTSLPAPESPSWSSRLCSRLLRCSRLSDLLPPDCCSATSERMKPIIGPFRHGDWDDIRRHGPLSLLQPASPSWTTPIDDEDRSGPLEIPPTAPKRPRPAPNGWFLDLAPGET